jgi:hypothetical protein
MILAAHQPNYLPNPGFFYKMAQADLFVIVTNLQFEKQERWQQRHKIPGPHGDLWLTVPVFGSQNQRIKEVRINNDLPWRRRQKRTLEFLYRNSASGEILARILPIYETQWERLVDLNVALIKTMKEVLGIRTRLVVDEEISGEKEALLVNICKKYQADEYLSGLGATAYMSERYFSELGRNRIRHRFVERNVTAHYPYSMLHYLLTQRPEEVARMITDP